jgi:hypothetical protein
MHDAARLQIEMPARPAREVAVLDDTDLRPLIYGDEHEDIIDELKSGGRCVCSALQAWAMDRRVLSLCNRA